MDFPLKAECIRDPIIHRRLYSVYYVVAAVTRARRKGGNKGSDTLLCSKDDCPALSASEESREEEPGRTFCFDGSSHWRPFTSAKMFGP